MAPGKYELSSKASWRKLHAGVNQSHYFESCVLTDRFDPDDQQVDDLLAQIVEPIDHFTADGAYDKSAAYHARDFERQKQEAMIGCGVLNKMTSLGMPVSYRSA